MHGLSSWPCSVVALLCAALLLSGCYLSKTPLITPETADYPIASDSHFAAFARRGEDWRPMPHGRTVRRAGGYYFFRDDESDDTSLPFLMKAVAPGRYVVQANDTSDFTRVTEYYYLLLDFDGAEAIQYSTTCWPREEWISEGLVTRIEQTAVNARCHFDSLEDLTTVLVGTMEYAAPEERFVLGAAP